MFVEILAGSLTAGGSSHPDNPTADRAINNLLSILIDPERMAGSGAMAADIDRLVAWVKASPPATPGGEVLLPGEIERRTRDERRAARHPARPQHACPGARRRDLGRRAGRGDRARPRRGLIAVSLPQTAPLRVERLTVAVYRAPVDAAGAHRVRRDDRPAGGDRPRRKRRHRRLRRDLVQFSDLRRRAPRAPAGERVPALGRRPGMAVAGASVRRAQRALAPPGAAGRRAGSDRPGDRRHRHGPLGPRGAAGRPAALAPARRQPRPHAGLCERHQPRSRRRSRPKPPGPRAFAPSS